MGDVQFEEENKYTYVNRTPEENPSGLSKLAMKLGAKTNEQAQIILFGVAILAVILTIIVIATQFGSSDAPVHGVGLPPPVFPSSQ